ncbi:MAG: transglutaminaseTgpA domain-containing protein, partial [Chloroflexota bacterium]
MEKTSSRWWDIPSAILLVAAILVSTWRLTITNWTPHVGYVSNMALAGALLGLALGQSRFGKWSVRLLSLGYTLVFLAWQLTGFYDDEIALTDSLYNIGNRILYSFGQYAANKPVRDELFVVFLLSLGYWAIGLIAGYSLTRRGGFIAAVLPAAVAMLIVNQYDPGHPGRIWFIAVYFMLALGLLGRQQFVRRRLEWMKNKVQLAPETAQELSTAALVVAGTLVMLAWLVPAHPSAALSDLWHEISEPWEATRERWRKAFASVESDTTRIEYVRDTLFLGDNATLDKSLVFTVNAPPEALTLPRLYWRGRVYDHYENGEWTSGERLVASFSPEEDEFNTPDNILRDEYEFTFTAYIQDQETLYIPGQPLWVSHGARARLVEISSGRQDILALMANPMIQAGESYSTRSALANPSIQELRDATTVYPLWVQDRYLQLPEDFPASIRIYAEKITEGLETPYDKAEAITNALRSEIAYKTVITPPTDGSDVIEWFLFESKEGYCNYYATAEVLMLRSIGIPARMAVGFSRGDTSP